MGRTHATIFCLILTAALIVCPEWAVRLQAQQDNRGSHAVMKDYLLPQYRGNDNRLQFIVYGNEAMNKGSLVYLDGAMIDIMNNEIESLDQVKVYTPGRESLPTPYPLFASKSVFRDFWRNPKHRHSRAWIFSEKAVFDKTTNILRSDEKAFFRSRELDVDGEGFDAYHERKFIHIRQNVKVVIRPEMRTNINPEQKTSGSNLPSQGNKENTK